MIELPMYLRRIISYISSSTRTTNVYQARGEILTFCKRSRDEWEEQEACNDASSESSESDDIVQPQPKRREPLTAEERQRRRFERRMQNYQAEPLTHFTKYLYKFAKHRAKSATPPIPFEITVQDILDRYKEQDGRCALSGLPMTYNWDPVNYDPKKFNAYRTYNISLDQRVPGQGYTKENMQLVILQCNFMKLNCSQDLFLDLCEAVYKHSRAVAR